MSAQDVAWTRGLGYAIAQIVRLHDDPVCAADVIGESGLHYKDFDVVPPYDRAVIRKLFRTEHQLRGLYEQRNTKPEPVRDVTCMHCKASGELLDDQK